ncbi:hypothetical protein [Streptomyces sp. NPDC050560]|uniref:hypothetical protein n=1 Tax=Streptomyces sp. NPDC050560 TaxID=3365630 RepID=UPI0037A0940C
MTSVANPPGGRRPGAARRGPHADCVADSAGGITFDITDGAALGEGSHVLLRLRGAPDPGQEVRLPLTPAGDGRLRAALPGSVALAEGRWDAYVTAPGAGPVRLAPGVGDLRSLVDRIPAGDRGPIAVRIPYPTAQGHLSVRCWHRSLHAEAGELLVGDGTLTVHGRVYGTVLTDAAHLELRARRPSRSVLRPGGCAVVGERFSCTIGYGPLAAEPGVWDLWLRPDGEAGPRVRVARLLDDVADKKTVFTYPTVTLPGPRGPVDAGPYYTLDNDLAIRVAERG